MRGRLVVAGKAAGKVRWRGEGSFESRGYWVSGRTANGKNGGDAWKGGREEERMRGALLRRGDLREVL